MLLVIAIALVILLIAVVSSMLLSNSKEITMENTAKNFALQLGSLVTLYVSLSALTVLLFNVITVQYPDATQGYWEYESATTGIRFGIALLIVFFPAYVVLTRFVNVIRRKEQGAYLVLTKWLIYLSLVIGGGVILGDLVAVINSFLNGELTIRFMLKALVMLVVIGAAFTYYLFDARGYWQTHEKESKQYAAGAALIVVAALVLGFMHTETPAQVRELSRGFWRIIVHYGFADEPNLPAAMQMAAKHGLVMDPEAVSYFIGRERIVPRAKSAMSGWRRWLFILLSDTEISASDYFRIPVGRIIELGARTEI